MKQENANALKYAAIDGGLFGLILLLTAAVAIAFTPPNTFTRGLVVGSGITFGALMVMSRMSATLGGASDE